MRIAVVGAGAIGCLFGIRLSQSGQEILLVNHDPKIVASIRLRGLKLIDDSGKSFRANIGIKQLLSKKDKPDLVLLTVKAYDTRSVAKDLSKVVDRETPILSLQNGLGNIETLHRYLPHSEILAGTTTEPALMVSPGAVMHPGTGRTWIGELNHRHSKRSKVIRRALQRGGFQTLLRTNIENVIWSKAIVNSAINPVSALAHVANGKILSNANLNQASKILLDEGIKVAKAAGVHPSPPPLVLFSDILRSTSANRSSMLRDIEKGKKTEVRQLNGSIADQGRRLGVPVPVNTLITRLIIGLEKLGAQNSPTQVTGRGKPLQST